jgi:hypothetical protein
VRARKRGDSSRAAYRIRRAGSSTRNVLKLIARLGRFVNRTGALAGFLVRRTTPRDHVRMLATIAPLAALPALSTFVLMTLTLLPRGSFRDRRALSQI